MQKELQTELEEILREKVDKVSDLVKRAIRAGINVTILVHSEPERVHAIAFSMLLELSSQESAFVHVDSILHQNDHPERLKVHLQNICSC